jgi:hypothetical protein
MVDVTLFHAEDAPANADFTWKDRFNGWTSHGRCRFLEWTGWYNFGVAQRLLGHYRLFQLYKAAFSKAAHDLPVFQSYIFQYRANHAVKYFLSRATSYMWSITTRNEYYIGVEIAAVNRQLVNESAGILYDFLIEAETDFAAALRKAVHRISQPDFFNKTPIPSTVNVQVNKKEENHHTHLSNTYNQVNSQVNIQPTIREGAQGKESGVFSKKQTLILFDLLTKAGNFDPIDLENPNKFDAYTDLLHALTGKSRQSFKEELNDYRTRGLYEWHTPGEFTQLINTLTQLLTYFEKAGFEAFAKVIDKKIRALREKKRS